MVEPIYDHREQLEKIKALLVPNEILYGVFDLKGGGTGFVGVTDRRLIFMDQAFLGRQKAVVSLPYTKITMIGAEDSGKIILGSLFGSSKLTVVSDERVWDFEFRSDAKAHRAYTLIMQNLLQTGVQEV